MDYLKVTPKEDLFLQQMELEEAMTALGAERFRSRCAKDVARGSEDATAYGASIITHCTDKVAEGVREFLRKAEGGGAGRRHAAYKFIKQLDPRVTAYLSLKMVLSSISHVVRIQTVAMHLSQMLEDEVRYQAVREEDRKLYRYLKEEAKKRDDYRNKRTTVNFMLNKFGHEWEGWTMKQRIHVGMKMIDIIQETVGLVKSTHTKEGRNNTVLYLAPTEETLRWIEQRKTAAAMLQPVYEPMVIPPQEWSSPWGGGYMTRHVRPLKLVKSRMRGYLEDLENEEMPGVYAAVNAAQNTAWSINLYILDVLTHIWDNSSTHGNIPSRYDLEIPPKPHDIETNEEARKAWRIQAAKTHRENRERLSKRTQFAAAITTATKYSLFEALYFPHQFDFRGRIYAVPQFNPQGPDYMKGLLHFTEPKPLDEESASFLAIHLANCGAFEKTDKAPLEQRVRWVYDNEARIVATAKDPFADLWWTEADYPFQFLAACNEWAGWLEQGVGYLSRLAVALDGSCSGIQHFSMALKDDVGGAAVNLTPSKEPADIYTLVMEQAYAQMKADAGQDTDPTKRDIALQWLQFKPERGCFKRPTMTYGYGSREYGFRDQIMTDTLRPAFRAYQRGEDVVWPFDADGFAASLYMAKVIAAAVDRVVVKAAEAMAWLKDTANLISKEELPIKWTTPDGFPVLQAYQNLKNHRIETTIAGSRTVVTLTEKQNQIDKRLQAQGISPNFVHSLDGTHLRVSVVRAAEEGMTSFALVHDSFGVHVADTPRFFQLLRETLVEIYTNCDVLRSFMEEIKQQLSEEQRDKLKEPPAEGNLELADVIESDYCFA